MRDRMKKTIITLLVVTAMMIGIMPFENIEIIADGEDNAEITLSETSIEMYLEETYKLIANREDVVWDSTDPSVAGVDDTGIVFAVGVGDAVIIASSSDGNYSASCDVTVKEYVTATDQDTEVKYPLWVGSVQVTSKNKDDILGDGGKAKYDPETKTLTLNNANITNTYKRNCIYANSLGGTLTISLIGSNRIGNKDALNGIDAMLTPTVITGDGNLTVSDVTNLGIMDEGSSITIKDTEVTVENCHFGIDGTYQFEIDNSKVTVTGGTEGISNDKISITDSKIDVTASYVGIFAVDNKISISGNSYVSADTTDSGAKAEKYAMVATKGFELDGVEIIEPEGGEIQPKTIGAQERYAVVDKDNNIAQKAVIAKTYLITFKNDDGTVLQEKKTPIYETPKYEGDTPTKPSDDEYEYTFKGWDKEITEVKGDATYTAVYDRTPIEKPTPTPTPVTPFSIPKTGIEGSSPSYHLISLLGVCMLTIFLAKKHN